MCVVRLDRTAAILNRNLLYRDQGYNCSSNVNLSPAIGDGRETAMYVTHGGGQHLHFLQFQVLFDFSNSFGIVNSDTAADRHLLGLTVQNRHQLSVTVEAAADIAQLRIHVFNQTGKG